MPHRVLQTLHDLPTHVAIDAYPIQPGAFGKLRQYRAFVRREEEIIVAGGAGLHFDASGFTVPRRMNVITSGNIFISQDTHAICRIRATQRAQARDLRDIGHAFARATDLGIPVQFTAQHVGGDCAPHRG